MKLNKILATVLAFAMVLSTMTFTAFAEGTIYSVADDTELKAALAAVVDGDTIKLEAGTYTGGISVGKEITLEGSVDADGNPTTVFSGNNGGKSYYQYSIYMNKGTIKNVKIVDAWKGVMTEGTGSLTLDNVTMVEIMYGIHIAEEKNSDDVVTVQNSNIDIAWANSFAGGNYSIVMMNNVLTANNPYYGKEYGANLINTFAPNTTIKNNVFGEGAKILVREEAKAGVDIGANYYEAGVQNALSEDCAAGVKVATYYADANMTEEKETPDGKITFGFTTGTRVWGEGSANAKESFVVELYSDDEKIAQASLNDYNDIINGNVYVTWGIPFNGADSDYWDVEWYGNNPHVDVVPTEVVLVVDGMVVSKNDVQMNGPDNLNPVEWNKLEGVPAAVKNGDVKYSTLQKAFAVAADGDTITLLEDITLDESITNTKNITLDLNGKTITGKDDTTKSFGLITNRGTLTITGNGTMTLESSVNSGWGRYSSVLSNTVGGKLVIENGTFEHLGGTDMAYAIDNLTNGKGTYAETIINGGNIISPYRAVRQFLNGVEAENILTVNGGTITGANKSIWMQDPSANSNSGELTVKGDAKLYGDVFLSVTAGSTEWPVEVFVASAALTEESKVLTNDNVPAGYDVIRSANGYEVTTKETEQADTISVIYEEASKVEGETVYNIVLKANDGDVINELASADLTFVYTTAPVNGGAIDFTVAPATGFSMTRYENRDRYMFNYNGVDNSYEGTANAIVIGTITVTGYGKYTIATKAFDTTTEVDTNIVNATTVNDNLVDSYTVSGAIDGNDATGSLDISHSVVDAKIAVPTRKLTINIDFPNAVEDNEFAYQDMKVAITGIFDGVNTTKTYTLGKGGDFEMVNGSYVVTEDNLVLNNAYTVTVEGAGYRTARYTVTMTGEKTLNFWNNVMDKAQVIETNATTGAVTKNFLAGDIVKDNNINIYDLSAVVSYFGSASTTENGYAKYDLNRDGVIDSKDVAYVLVSWNE